MLSRFRPCASSLAFVHSGFWREDEEKKQKHRNIRGRLSEVNFRTGAGSDVSVCGRGGVGIVLG